MYHHTDRLGSNALYQTADVFFFSNIFVKIYDRKPYAQTKDDFKEYIKDLSNGIVNRWNLEDISQSQYYEEIKKDQFRFLQAL